MFELNSGRYNLYLINSYLIPYLYVIKKLKSIRKENDFISIKFGHVQFLDIRKVFGGAKTLDSFLKLIKPRKPKSFFRTNSLTVQTSLAVRICLHMKPFSANGEITTLSRKISTSTKKLLMAGLITNVR